MNELRSLYASTVAALSTIVVMTAVTIAGELSAPFKTWLTGFTGHHWITKSWLTLILYVGVFFIVRLWHKELNATQTRRALWMLATVALLAAMTLVGFYMFEYFVV